MSAAASLCVTLVLCTGCHRIESTDAVSAVDIDGRQWTPVGKAVHRRAGRDYVKEYLPSGQTVNDWTEIITVQQFSTALPNANITPASFETEFLKSLDTSAGKIDSRDISTSDTDRLFDWRTQADHAPKGSAGLLRVTQQDHSLEILQYTSKEHMSEDQSRKWQAILSGTTLQNL